MGATLLGIGTALGFLMLPALASGQGGAGAIFLVSGGAPGNATGFFSGDDDAPGIQSAIDAAIAWLENPANAGAGPASVIFEAGGSYHLETTLPNDPVFALLIKQLQNHSDRLQLMGNGATLVHKQKLNQTLGIRSSSQVLVRDLFFDRDPLPYMDGIVETVNGNLVTIRHVRGLSPLDFPPIGSSGGNIRHWGWLLDPEVPGRPKTGTATFYEASSVSQQSTDPDLYDFVFGAMGGVPIPEDFTAGDRFSYHYREGGNNLHIRNAAEIEIRNVTSYAASAMFLNASDTDGLSVVDSHVVIPPGHWRSTNGDGVHVKRSTQLNIEDCSFAGVSDDAINITEVGGFSVLNNFFWNKRRHAILFDADDQGGNPPNSTDGVVQGNRATFNGGSFISHKGGDYSSVTIGPNHARNNNTTRAYGANHHLRLMARSGGLAVAGAIGGDGIWSDGDNVEAAADLFETDRAWHVQEVAGGNVVIIHRAARDQNAWLYLASASASSIGPGENVLLRPPQGQNNASEAYWSLQSIGETDFVRIRHSLSGLYLTLNPSASGPTAGDNLLLESLDTSNLNQAWQMRDLEDSGSGVPVPALGGVGVSLLITALGTLGMRRSRAGRRQEGGSRRAGRARSIGESCG